MRSSVKIKDEWRVRDRIQWESAYLVYERPWVSSTRQTVKQKALVVSHGNPSTLSLSVLTFPSPLAPPTPSFPILTVLLCCFFF